MGFLPLENFIAEVNKKADIEISIPKTFVISNKAFEELSFSAVDWAMKLLVSCGGNVAVRSSADVEDGQDKSYSGEFSVLS